MGRVFRARDGRGQLAALKLVRTPSDAHREALAREVRLLARLEHPDLVRVLGHDLTTTEPWVALSWVDGCALDAWQPAGGATLTLAGACTATLDAEAWVQAGPVPAPEAVWERLALVTRLCTPLGWLHGEGLVHRDLKPGNVRVRPDGRPVLLDFGIAHALRGEHGRDEADAVQVDGSGTPAWIAPEQVLGEPTDARTDLYALGAVLFALVTGRPPFVGPARDVLRAHVADPPPRLRDRREGVPEDLDALVAALLAKDPADRPTTAGEVARRLVALGVPADDARRPPARAFLYRRGLAGRQREREALRSAVERGATVVLRGPAGQGKTRLVLEIARQARREGRPVVVDACADRTRAQRALGAAAAWLEGADDALPQPVRAVLHHDAGLPVGAAPPPPPVLEPDAARRRRVEAVASLLAAWGRSVRSLWILDDVAHADGFTVDVITRLATAHPGALATVATLRSGDEGEALAQLLPAVQVLDLGALDEDAMGQLAAASLGADAVPQHLVAQLQARAEGNPLYAQELLADALLSGVLLRDESGRWILGDDDPRSPGILALDGAPSSVVALIGARVARLSPSARALVEASAVWGREASGPVVEALGGDVHGLPELLRGQLLEPWQDGWRFPHAVQHEAVLAGLGPERRQALHRAAAALASRRGRPAAEVAGHWLASDTPHEAVPWLRRAAEEADADAEPASAARALERIAPLLPDAEGATALAGACSRWVRAGHVRAVDALAPRAFEALARQGRRGELALLRGRVAVARVFARGPAHALELVEQALTECDPPDRPRFLVERATLRAMLVGPAARSFAEEAEAALGDLPEGPDRRRVASRLGHAWMLVGDAAAADTLLTRANSVDDPHDTRESVLGNLAIAAYARGDLDRSEACLREAADLAIRLHKAEGTARHRINLAELLVERGALDEALSVARQAARDFRSLGHALAALHSVQVWSRAARLLGEPTGPLRQALDEGLAASADAPASLRLRPLIERVLLDLADGRRPDLLDAVRAAQAHAGVVPDDTPHGRAVARLDAALAAFDAGGTLVSGEAPHTWPPPLRAAVYPRGAA